MFLLLWFILVNLFWIWLFTTRMLMFKCDSKISIWLMQLSCVISWEAYQMTERFKKSFFIYSEKRELLSTIDSAMQCHVCVELRQTHSIFVGFHGFLHMFLEALDHHGFAHIFRGTGPAEIQKGFTQKTGRNGPSILSKLTETLRVHIYKCVYSLAGVIADCNTHLMLRRTTV